MLPRSRWTCASTAFVVASSLEAEQHLVDHDLVEELAARERRDSLREARRAVAAAVDEIGDTVAAERAQRGVHGERACAARRLRRPIGSVASPLSLPLEVRRLHRHGRDVRVGPRAEDEPAVVRDVEPLVRVGGPRIGERDALDEVPALRAHRGPQPERAVDVEPGVRLAHDRRRSAGRDRTSRCSPRPPARRRSSGRSSSASAARSPSGSHSTLVVGVHDHELGGADPQQPQRAVDRHVAESPDDDADRRRPCEPALADIPASLREDLRAVRRRVQSRAPSDSPW